MLMVALGFAKTAQAQGPADPNNIVPVDGDGVVYASGADYTATFSTAFAPQHIQPGEGFVYRAITTYQPQETSGCQDGPRGAVPFGFYKVPAGATYFSGDSEGVQIDGSHESQTCADGGGYKVTTTHTVSGAATADLEPGCYQGDNWNNTFTIPGSQANGGSLSTLQVGNVRGGCATAGECEHGFLAREWAGYSVDALAAADDFDASYGLAVKWHCTATGAVELDSADVRLVEDAGSSDLAGQLSKVFGVLAGDLRHEWNPYKKKSRRKVKVEQLADGGIKVTAATGYFDVCADPSELIAAVFSPGLKLWKRLPERVRRRLVRPVVGRVFKRLETFLKLRGKHERRQLIDKNKARLKTEINPETGRTWTNSQIEDWARDRARRNQRSRRRAYEALIEQITAKVIDATKLTDICVWGWKPKVVARIKATGTATMEETGDVRDGFWWVAPL